MSQSDLSQSEANRLFGLPKRRLDNTRFTFPPMGEGLEIPLVSMDQKEEFLLNVSRGTIRILKVTQQIRTQNVYVLARLDLGGAPHRNPDGTIVECPHLHLYREGYGDKWAQAVDPTIFTELANLARTYEQFLAYCNVTEPPNMQYELN